jgi:hypothetical protein
MTVGYLAPGSFGTMRTGHRAIWSSRYETLPNGISGMAA